mmetsp:Transcript_40837/g.107942  ORF Transcript_40837/g.107942 Transcript_40837/m.107942 type:complete len:213 (+) Transcript_40837:202-840(+)
MNSGYLSPCTAFQSTSPPIEARVSFGNSKLSVADATFDSALATFVVPGIGKTSSPMLCSQAKDSFAGVRPSSKAFFSRGSRSLAFASTLASPRTPVIVWKPLRAPPPSGLPIWAQSSIFFTVALAKPRQSGLYATMAMPSSRQVGTTSASRLRMSNDHSCWTAVSGWMSCAIRICAGVASERPKYLILPSATSSLQAAIQLFRPSSEGMRWQ